MLKRSLQPTIYSRHYAKVIDGILNQPAPSPTTPQANPSISQVREKVNQLESFVRNRTQSEKGSSPKGFHLDISKPPPSATFPAQYARVNEPPQVIPHHALHNYLMRAISSDSRFQASPSLKNIMLDLTDKANAEIPHVLHNGNAGSPEISLDEVAASVVTIAYVLPACHTKPQGEVIICSGFALLDGSLIATCAHPMHQMNAHCRSYDAIEQQKNGKSVKTVIITNSGDLVPLLGVESHLVMSDVVLLRIPKTTGLTPLKVSPYPCPAGNAIQVYNLNRTSLNNESRPAITWSWKHSEVTVYQDRAGREAVTGSYDELNTLLFNTVPSPGSSGGPILDRETKAVIGIVRGSEIFYAVRKERGFSTPAETLFNVFKLDM